jgi:hypothetical protein
MTLRELLNQGIEIQGNVIIKRYNEETENHTILYKWNNGIEIYSNRIFEKIIDNEITYMYCEDRYMVFEIR